jgi:hypothetical protein
MKTETTKPTLESLGLQCAIASAGIGKIQDGENNMLKWIAQFWRSDRTEASAVSFDYYTGAGCGPKIHTRLEQVPLNIRHKLGRDADYFNVQPASRYLIKDKSIEARIALLYALHHKWKPDPIEILWAIARDSDALEMVFDDWASELGYNTDSRKAEAVYRACQDNALRLKKILPPAQIEMLKNLDL